MTTCQRCRKRTRAQNVFIHGWASLFGGGYMCPTCYAGLQAIRRECEEYCNQRIALYMELEKGRTLITHQQNTGDRGGTMEPTKTVDELIARLQELRQRAGDDCQVEAG